MIIKVALKSLMANKLRSLLAMLGIIIGVGAVIAMLAIGNGTQQQVLSRITSLGTNLLSIRPGQRGFGGVMSGTQQNLSLDDAAAIVKLPGVQAVAPGVSRSMQVKFFNQNTQTNIIGTSVTYMTIHDYEMDRGRMFTEQEVDHWERVAVIGPDTATNLFGISDPIDQTVKINGINFRIVGLVKPKGDTFGTPDDQIVVPYTTAMHILMGVTILRVIDVEVESMDKIDAVQNDISMLLRRLHKVQASDPDDVTINNQADFIQRATEFTQSFKFLLGWVAGISLLVGGIGIMNIMLVTVTERTREIGVRKAIGARDYDILSQFLIEAIIMTGVGGMIGTLSGVGTAVLIRRATTYPTIVTTYSIALALIVTAAVGIFFGFYPATRAAKLDPIEALRYE